MAIGAGAAVAGWMGLSASVGVGAVIAASVNAAIIGAAIGAIRAAATDGSILKGALYGAVGGAVMGGIFSAAGQFLSASASGAGSSGTVAQGGFAAGTDAANLHAAENIANMGAGGGGGGAGGGALDLSKDMVGHAVAGIGKVGDYMAAQDAASELAKTTKERDQLLHEQKMEALQVELDAASRSGGGGSDALAIKRLDMQQRDKEYNLAKRDEALKRERQASTLRGMKVKGGDDVSITQRTNTPGQAMEGALSPDVLQFEQEV